MKSVAVCIAKDEDKYIDEWLEYNLKLGFDDIFLYQNNWKYSGNVKSDKIHLMTIDGEKIQNKCYNDFIDQYYDKYDFATFIDVDEFIVLNTKKTINEYLEDYEQCDVIYVNWRLFGDNGLKTVENGEYSVLKRFTRCQKELYHLGKNIINFKKVGKNVKFYNPHIVIKDCTEKPQVANIFDANGTRCQQNPWSLTDNGTYKPVEIFHYRNKSYQECYERKFNKPEVFWGDGQWVDKERFDKEYENHNKNDVVNTSALNFMYPEWLILVVGTDKIFKEFYKNDPKFNKNNYKFFNVSEKRFESDVLEVINSSDIEGYERLGYPYAESEVMYNIYKLGLFKEFKYIGFIHYDFNLYNKKNNTYNITLNIERILDYGYDYISFQNMNLGYVYNNANIMLDERDHNCVFPQFSPVKDPKTAFDYTFKHIESVFGKKLTIHNMDLNQTVNMCCSFLMKRDIFDKLGKLIVSMIDEHYMDKFDDRKVNRIPGNVMERVIAIFSAFHRHFPLDLDHKHITSDEFIRNGTLKDNIRY